MTTEASFLKDVENHQMTVLRDAGVHRHIRFRKPGTICMGFDFITWPGHLCYTGDMGTYVFQRLEDMFEFFRTGRPQDGLYINTGYWEEKLLADDIHGRTRAFDEEEFDRTVKKLALYWMRSRFGVTNSEERRELWDAVIDQIINRESDPDGDLKRHYAYEFNHRVNADVGSFWYQDLWEYNFQKYTHHFRWCCYAIAWGIQQYDQRDAAVAMFEQATP